MKTPAPISWPAPAIAWVRRLRTPRRILLPAAIFALIACASLLAPWLSQVDPNAIDLAATFQPPSAQHWFGTDQMGRDVFVRTLHGGRISLFIAFCAVALAGVSGALAGILSAYLGGRFDGAMMRLVDAQYALPPVFLAMLIVGVFGPSITNIIVVVTLANWGRFARIIRAEALSLRERDFVLVARLVGASPWHVAWRHLLPNVRNTFIVLLTLDVGLIVFMEAALSFLGLGVQPPDPSWGSMIADGRNHLENAWWISALPGLVLMATVLCANLIGEAFQDGKPLMARRA
ncbi:ABC transporter permease [Bordetella genomosp. 12]|uniref:Peptide ABC transporter permease n=1 Tax=Bordetella genomosp. 12 TaxID=463035 RepID=A0A261VEF6_9BORD|nr:ABC transporter permease [Bordetella genomosp. 12]OZI71932.1 peptide ABC transporter permease [Bordetella genomosp. 12]